MADLFANVWIFDVEVVVAGFDVVDRHFPGLFALLSAGVAVGGIAPPVDFGLKFFKTHRLGFVVAFYAVRVRVLVIPDRLGRLCLW